MGRGRPRKVRPENVSIMYIPDADLEGALADMAEDALPKIRSVRFIEDIPIGNSYTMTRQITSGDIFVDKKAELSFDHDERFLRCVVGNCVNLIPFTVVGSIYMESAT